MNSLIIESIYKLCSVIYCYIEKSRVYSLFMKIYSVIALWWKDSIIMSFLRGAKGSVQSDVFKVMRIPVTIMEFINKKCTDFFERNIENSVAVKLGKGIISGALSLNTRFIGLYLLFSFGIASVLSIIGAKGITKGGMIYIVIAVFGVVLSAFSVNIMKYFEESIVLGFVGPFKKILKIDNVYTEEFSKSIYPVVGAVLLGIVSGVCTKINILLLPVSAVAVFVLLLILQVPFAGVVLAVFSAPFLPTMAVAGICIYTTLAFLIKALTTPGFKWRFGAVGSGIMLLLVILFVTSLFSCSAKSSLMVWAMYFVFMIFFFIVLNCIETKQDVSVLLGTFAVAALGVAAYGIMQYLFGWTTDNAWIDENMFGESMRVYSTLGNPNVLGEYLILALPISVIFFVNTHRKYYSKWFFMAVFAVLALCLVLTQSRGCWLGFIFAAVIFISFWNGKIWGLAALAVCILPWIVPESIVSRIASIGNMGDSSTSYRVFIWLGTLDMLKDYWIGGIGMGEGAFGLVYPEYSYSAIIAPHSHNVYLQLMVEGGISTLIIFLAIMFIFLRQLYETYRVSEQKSTERLIALCLGAGMAAFLLQSMFDYTFYNYRVMGIFFMYMAIGTAHYMLCVKNKIYPGERKECDG